MSKRYYSQTTGCCYIEGVHAKMPKDAVEIDAARYDEVIANPDPTKVRSHDAGGLPILVEPTWPPSNVLALVDAERDRRSAAGYMFEGVLFQIERQSDQDNILGAAYSSLAAIMAGAVEGNLRWSNPDEDFFWIATDNSRIPMDAFKTKAFAQGAMAFKAKLVVSGSNLKALDEIPADYADDKWWL